MAVILKMDDHIAIRKKQLYDHPNIEVITTLIIFVNFKKSSTLIS